MNAETILNAAIGVLERRGRCTGHFEIAGGQVDPLGALAVAAGMEPDTWMGLREYPAEWMDEQDGRLVAAARLLAEVAVPGQCPPDMPVHDLVGVLGDWSDAAIDAQVFDALAKAARAASVRDYQTTGDAA